MAGSWGAGELGAEALDFRKLLEDAGIQFRIQNQLLEPGFRLTRSVHALHCSVKVGCLLSQSPSSLSLALAPFSVPPCCNELNNQSRRPKSKFRAAAFTGLSEACAETL